jgi:hypothetical protein
MGLFCDDVSLSSFSDTRFQVTNPQNPLYKEVDITAFTKDLMMMCSFSWALPSFVALNQPPIGCSFMFIAIIVLFFSCIMIVKCHFFFVFMPENCGR